MANLETKRNRNGINIKIHFTLNRERKKLCLGSKYTLKQADRLRMYVEELADAKETGGRVSRATAAFIADMTDDLRERFSACGLIDCPAVRTNRDLWTTFLADTESARKASTQTTYHTVKKRFFDFFKPSGDPRQITKRDGENWKAHLHRSGLAEASVAGSFQKANAVFNWAVENEYLEKNPFKGIRRGSMRNPDRNFYVPLDWYRKLLDACPDQTWRTILALCRIGGLRNPSETLALTWADVDFANRSILVHSPKTEHHYGKGTRLIPMFPGLREELEAQWELTEEGCSPYVIDKWRDTTANMRTHFQRIIFRAGLPEWDRLFQNLRASRSTDICNEYPAYVEKAWIGHSEKIAEAHYLQVTDDHFQRALNPSPCTPKSAGDISGSGQARETPLKQGRPQKVLGYNS